jgi:hypothetical protein
MIMLQRQLGKISINRIIEWDEPNFDPLAFFPQTTLEDWEPHKQWLDPVSGYITLPMQSYLLRTRHHTILGSVQYRCCWRILTDKVSMI